MDHHPFPTNTTTNTPSRAEAERLLGVALKLLHSHDLSGSREFALLAQETDPLLEGSDQILAITDVLLASEKRVNNNRHHDWYSILQTDRRSDPDLLRKNYRRLALLLHPDKNNYPLADGAFKLVADAWGVLSDPTKRTPYDHELSLFSKVDLRHTPVDKDKLPVRRSSRGGGDAPLNDTAPPPHAASASGTMNQGVHQSRGGAGVGSGSTGTGTGSNFWTACPYCYVLYEYPRVYKEYCIRCQNCDRAFHAAALPSMPPMVPGKEAYYCCWGFFPIGFSVESGGKGKKVDASNVQGINSNNNNNNNNANNVAGGVSNNNENPNMGFPNWMPGMFTMPVPDGAPTPQHHGGNANANANVNMNNTPNVNMNAAGATVVDFSAGNASAGFGNAVPGMSTPGAKKRGRPRKNPM